MKEAIGSSNLSWETGSTGLGVCFVAQSEGICRPLQPPRKHIIPIIFNRQDYLYKESVGGRNTRERIILSWRN